MDCGPHKSASSPYDYIHDQIQDGPSWLRNVTYYTTVSTTTVALIIGSICVQMYFRSVNKSLEKKVNAALQIMLEELHDKNQLLRANGIKF